MAGITPKKDVPLSSHTVFRIGGVCRYFYEARSEEALIEAADWAAAYELPVFVLGAGSNILASEKGFQGLVVRPVYSDLRVMGNVIHAGAGAMMPHVAAYAQKEGLSGFEWAIGIPGTVGGSVRGNAGCNGSSMADVVDSVRVYNAAFKRMKKLSTADCRFGYRDSKFKHHPELVILSAAIGLHPGGREAITEKMREYSLHRVATQDIGSQCAGCVFKNIPWERVPFDRRERLLTRFPELQRFKNQSHIPTAFLIDVLGLKGHAIGGAMVSKKHGNFFLNTSGATFHDLAILISHCKEYVHRKTGLLLEEEIQYL